LWAVRDNHSLSFTVDLVTGSQIMNCE
jgi:hypothetical protein